MFNFFGRKEGSEYQAAESIRDNIFNLWPDLANSKTDHVNFYVSSKFYGAAIEDIDLLVLANFENPRQFDPGKAFQVFNSNERVVPQTAFVKNLALVIEVKSHDPSGVRFEGQSAFVRYTRNGTPYWDPVTEKNRDQMFVVRNALLARGWSIYVQNLIYFTGLHDKDVPSGDHNFITRSNSFEAVLNQIGGLVKAHLGTNNSATLMFSKDDQVKEAMDAASGLVPVLEPTSIDRRRMDRILKASLPHEWISELGTKTIVFRGRGGAGKTVILLQLAYQAYDRNQQRSLLLTYNKSLVADMKRTMAMMGIPKNLDTGGLHISTVHGFIRKVSKELGVLGDGRDFLGDYDEIKREILDYLEDEVITPQDIENLKHRLPSEFCWDLVFIDEGQDWPEDEILIIQKLYVHTSLVVADGVDQYVRQSVADWSLNVPKDKLRVRRLMRCLRMKENLATFNNTLAQKLGLLDWEAQPNKEASGGKVVIIEGDLVGKNSLVPPMIKDAKLLGNHPIDLLACVPPKLVVRTGDSYKSIPGKTLPLIGQDVWDGVSPDVRDAYPTKNSALRIVQYDSCRGLEGWTVINYQLDDFWVYKRDSKKQNFDTKYDLFESEEELAELEASRWLMIPLTRAIDTLIINVSERPSKLKAVLSDVYQENRDFVEWIQIPDAQ